MDRGSKKNDGVVERSKENQITRSEHLDVLGETCSARSASIHPEAQSSATKPAGAINTASVLRLLEWQGYRCALTGRSLTPDTASLDHVVPVRDGGEHTIENVQVLNKEVNRAKSTLSHEQFVQLCHEVVDHVASTNREGA